MGQKPLEMDCFLSYKYSQLSGAMGFTTTDFTNCDRKNTGKKNCLCPESGQGHFSLSLFPKQ